MWAVEDGLSLTMHTGNDNWQYALDNAISDISFEFENVSRFGKGRLRLPKYMVRRALLYTGSERQRERERESGVTAAGCVSKHGRVLSLTMCVSARPLTSNHPHLSTRGSPLAEAEHWAGGRDGVHTPTPGCSIGRVPSEL
jgi:hypothetical protein